MEILSKVHKHYGSLILLLVLIGFLFAALGRPRVVYQRIVAVLVDINVVIGLITLFWVTVRPVSWFHLIFALAAVGLLHASAKSADRGKVTRCWGLAFLLLIATWATNASWGPEIFKTNWLILPAASEVAPALPPTPGG